MQYALILAAYSNALNTLNILLQHKDILVDAADKKGRTALHYATACGYLDIVISLLKKGANPNYCDKDNKSPLDIAEENGHKEALEYMRTPVFY